MWSRYWNLASAHRWEEQDANASLQLAFRQDLVGRSQRAKIAESRPGGGAGFYPIRILRRGGFPLSNAFGAVWAKAKGDRQFSL